MDTRSSGTASPSEAIETPAGAAAAKTARRTRRKPADAQTGPLATPTRHPAPPEQHRAGAAPAVPDGRRTDISRDIEKDINIEVAITGNPASTVQYVSNITITYYNFENAGKRKPAASGDLRRSRKWRVQHVTR